MKKYVALVRGDNWSGENMWQEWGEYDTRKEATDAVKDVMLDNNAVAAAVATINRGWEFEQHYAKQVI